MELQDAVRFRGLNLPVRRSNEALGDDEAFVDSAVDQVRQVSEYHPFGSGTRVLDFGCGQGRFAIGLLASGTEFRGYLGVDTDEQAIGWCERWLGPLDPRLVFLYAPSHNARYNPSAVGRAPLQIPPGSFEVAFLNSVFSHMLADDVEHYLGELYRLVTAGGVVYMTAFVEDDVPPVTENPDGYLGRESRGPLHRVRYERSYFEGLVRAAGFDVVAVLHGGIERTGQSVIIAGRPTA